MQTRTISKCGDMMRYVKTNDAPSVQLILSNRSCTHIKPIFLFSTTPGLCKNQYLFFLIGLFLSFSFQQQHRQQQHYRVMCVSGFVQHAQIIGSHVYLDAEYIWNLGRMCIRVCAARTNHWVACASGSKRTSTSYIGGS